MKRSTAYLTDISYNAKRCFDSSSVDCAVLFGSYSKGTYDASSDIDILIAAKEPIDFDEYISLKLELEDVLNTKVDLVDIHDAKPYFIESIIETGNLIYGSSEDLHKILNANELLNDSNKPLIIDKSEVTPSKL